MAATVPLVLSEGEDPLGKVWRACTYAAGMMAAYAVAGGAAVFPKGYTGKERNALEASDNKPDNSPEGASLGDLDVALKARYGMSLNKVSGSLSSALERKGTVLVVQGTYGRLPDTLRLSKFTGGHAVTVIPQGNGKSLWLDPIAPSGSRGKLVDNSTILNFAWGPQFARVGKVADTTGGTSYTAEQWNAFIGTLKPGTRFISSSNVSEIVSKAKAQGIDLSGVDWPSLYGKSLSDLRDLLAAKDVIPPADLGKGIVPDIAGPLGEVMSGVAAIATYLVAVIIIVLGFYIYTKGGSKQPEVIVAPQ